MSGHDTKVVGSFETGSKADKAAGRLTSAGFLNSEVSLMKKDGGVWLSVHCSNSLEIDRANSILEENGAEHISSIGEPTVRTNS